MKIGKENFNEFRLGNLVYADSEDIYKPCEIESISRDCLFVIIDQSKKPYFMATIQVWSIVPIELEAKWFLKLGFEKDNSIGGYNIKINYYKQFMISEDSDRQGIYSVPIGDYRNGTDARIKYVHQLQNVYFLLTGKELVIK